MDRFEVEALYIAPDRSESVALVMLNGASKRVINNLCTNSYELVSGRVTFVNFDKDGVERKVHLSPGEAFTIPPGYEYQDLGSSAVMLCTSTPAFDQGQLTVVE